MLVVVVVAACSNSPQEPTWARIDLPADGTVVVRDVADCNGTWWAVGAVAAADGTTRPAAWTGGGGTGSAWAPVRFVPLPGSYYGPRQVIRSVACAEDKVAMVGATPGGAHGNPRVSTWRRLPDGRMAENAAPFETYGGDEAVDVGPIAAGPQGFAIAGNRSSGAAAWFSPDGRTYTLSESALAGTAARDVTALPDGRWLVTGESATASIDPAPAAWIVDHGRWTPGEAPAATSPATHGSTMLKVADDSLWQATG
ncbi:hypothetical protein [Actinoplanes sp. URMC 104]|uniref:hypothetical protein n=1 Tax=Actinoplanes sp. URMC 104 TaxID=3423409 RepID=UPI003F193919